MFICSVIYMLYILLCVCRIDYIYVHAYLLCVCVLYIDIVS